jgi:hypothetical protein
MSFPYIYILYKSQTISAAINWVSMREKQSGRTARAAQNRRGSVFRILVSTMQDEKGRSSK